MRKLFSNKKKNQGFTLVELIVVLVILAILAAILVPALLGYIDRAKQQQIVLNAKSCLTAAQAEMSSMYAKDTVNFSTAINERIYKTADVKCDELVIGCEKALEAGEHKAYTITFVYYEEDGNAVYFDGSSWEVAGDDDAEACAKIAGVDNVYTIVTGGEVKEITKPSDTQD
jgi:prepilin-type N-terminal cleavage/methylation domain-containing protein